jgi:hypothetical protein
MPSIKRVNRQESPLIDISCISAESFRIYIRRNENIVFSTSLYKLDHVIKEQEKQDNKETLSEIKAKLPAYLRSRESVFSKAAFNQLPSHRLYDYYI